MSKTVSARITNQEHEDLLDLANQKRITVNEILSQSIREMIQREKKKTLSFETLHEIQKLVGIGSS